MNETKLGQILPQDERRRDAVHVAVMPVIAAAELNPGDHIGFMKDSKELVDRAAMWRDMQPCGIVDPYLIGAVKEGQRFYMCMYPGTVTSLRHVWTHPAIPTTLGTEQKHQVDESEAWLKTYMHRLKPYTVRDKGIDAAYKDFLEELRGGGCIVSHGPEMNSYHELPGDPDEVFRHISIVLGHHVDSRSLTYACGC